MVYSILYKLGHRFNKFTYKPLKILFIEDFGYKSSFMHYVINLLSHVHIIKYVWFLASLNPKVD